MATIKSYTDLEQSRKLAEILPLESADMYYPWYIEEDGDTIEIGHRITTPKIGNFTTHKVNKMILPCWSLAALLAVLPAKCECMSLAQINYGNNHKEYFMSYTEGENTEDYANAIDACYEMVIYLHKINLL